jgi:sterol desaturase/sphingolipid hydroxylase (fatty acid hydroxylase superfamily)
MSGMSIKERLVRFRSFWIFPSLALFLIYVAFRNDTDNLRNMFWLFPLGIFAWTLIEYGLHRFVFHIDLSNPRVRDLINGTHVNHHLAPRDPDRLLVKTGYGMGVSALIFVNLWAVFGRFDFAVGMLSGIWAGFLYYEFVHYTAHLTSTTRGLMGRQRRAHFYHHFTNNGRCFGVTSPLWDYVFRTQLPRQRR